MTTLVIFFLSLCIGYYLFMVFSHPQKKKHKLPRIHYKNVELLPNFKIHISSKTYHVHHWLVLSIFTVGILYIYEGFAQLMVVKGVAIGGILQGLRYSDRFKFRHPRRTTR